MNTYHVLQDPHLQAINPKAQLAILALAGATNRKVLSGHFRGFIRISVASRAKNMLNESFVPSSANRRTPKQPQDMLGSHTRTQIHIIYI